LFDVSLNQQEKETILFTFKIKNIGIMNIQEFKNLVNELTDYENSTFGSAAKDICKNQDLQKCSSISNEDLETEGNTVANIYELYNDTFLVIVENEEIDEAHFAIGYDEATAKAKERVYDLRIEDEEKKPIFEIETYKKSASDKLSVYVLSNDEFKIEDAIEFADENCTTQIELIEENEKSVANEYCFKYAVVFHES
jgi:hypothetical protein